MSFDFEKLVGAIHYVCEKAGESALDPIKLNKVLWYSDCMAYLLRGRSITNATYIRKQHGPVPRAQKSAIDELENQGAIKVGQINENGTWEKRFDVIAEADKTRFDGEELAIIDRVFKAVSKKDSMEISEQTHGNVWELAAMNEPVPLYTVFAEKLAPITAEHIKLATVDLGRSTQHRSANHPPRLAHP